MNLIYELWKNNNFLIYVTIITVVAIAILAYPFLKKEYFPLGKPSFSEVKTIHYDRLSQESINAKNWFKNWDEGFLLNREFVQETCLGIVLGIYEFEWDTDYYCDKL